MMKIKFTPYVMLLALRYLRIRFELPFHGWNLSEIVAVCHYISVGHLMSGETSATRWRGLLEGRQGVHLIHQRGFFSFHCEYLLKCRIYRTTSTKYEINADKVCSAKCHASVF